MGYVEFEPGSAKLTDADTKKLDTIVKALADKPSIRMDLIGRVDPAVDEPALRTRYVDRLVKQQKIKDVVGNGESVDLSTVTVDPKDYDKYLTKAYKSADFKKPRNFVGLTKSLPDDDMKSALAANAPIDDASLRAARATARAERAAVSGRQDRQQPRVHRRAEAERRRHQGQGRDHARGLRPEVSERPPRQRMPQARASAPSTRFARSRARACRTRDRSCRSPRTHSRAAVRAARGGSLL